MQFSMSSVEVFLISVPAISLLVLYLRRDERWRWALVASLIIGCAALVTPADPFSTLLMAIVFLGFFVLGSRLRLDGHLDHQVQQSDGPHAENQNTKNARTCLRVAGVFAAIAIVVFIVGRGYAMNLTEPFFAHEVFRVWAANLVSALLLVAATTTLLLGAVREALSRKSPKGVGA